VQEARKNSGLDVADRIRLQWSGDGAAADALIEHRDEVAGEVLAVSLDRVDTLAGALASTELGLSFALTTA
jgi:isoleucyl-tRNA synthetase